MLESEVCVLGTDRRVMGGRSILIYGRCESAKGLSHCILTPSLNSTKLVKQAALTQLVVVHYRGTKHDFDIRHSKRYGLLF